MNNDASDRTLGLVNIWQVLRKLVWEVQLLKAIPDKIKIGEHPIDVLHYQDARLYAQINAATTNLALVDWLYHLIHDDQDMVQRAVDVIGGVDLSGIKAFRQSMRESNKSINACHQIGNANKHLYLSDYDSQFKVKPFDLILHDEDGTKYLSTISSIMWNRDDQTETGSVDDMLNKLMHWWYDTLDGLNIEGKDQFLPSAVSDYELASET